MIKGRFLVLLVVIFGLLAVAPLVNAQDKAITIWTKFNSDSPQNAQDEWMKATVDGYNADGGKLSNVFQPYDQINTKVNLAVQAGGDVPDVSYVDSQALGFFDYNGTLIDLTEWIKAQSWFADLSPAALAACTAPDGRLLCVPTSNSSTLVYYWTELYPDGFPATAEALLEDGARLKGDGKYALTFKGTEGFGLGVSYFSLINSAGATISDAEGKAAWASPEMVNVIEYVRTLFADGYAPEIALAGGFDYENVFKNADGGALLAGSWSYVFANPVTSPSGKTYDLGADSILKAAEDGLIGFAPPIAFEGGKVASLVSSTAWAIPVGSANEEEAKAFINYTMDATHNVSFGLGYGTLPALMSAQEDEAFQSAYWKTIADIQNQYGVSAPFLVEFDRGFTALADVFAKCLADPNLDVLATLQEAQDNYNASIQ